ncbi:MAG: peptide deformylase [Methyloligellaceae bacterium]
MAILDIITIPDPMLRDKSEPVERVDAELVKFTEDMLETMYDAPGVGLAAVQVAVPRRVIVMDISRDEDEERQPLVMINPKILKVGDEPRLYEEGCLSIPKIYAEIERPDKIEVEYLDTKGVMQHLKAEGMLSTVIQHEVDHLDGMLFIDYLSRLKRDRLVKKFHKMQKEEKM